MMGGGAASQAPKISAAELEDICLFVYQRTGMVFGESKRYYIERRIQTRIQQAGAATTKNYIAILHSSPAEAEQLVNSFTINETYFYREEHQLACLSQSILPEIIRSRGPGDRIRILSLPCSSGEEPYSIALWLLENWNLVDAYNIEIVGVDIDTAVLGLARAGVYGARSLSRLPENVIRDYFEPPVDKQRQLIGDIRESVTFRSANIVDRASIASIGKFDVIFCRNLLIYFDDVSRVAAIGNLHDILAPNGYICLGHTESMSRISSKFEAVRFPDAIVYREPEKVRG